MIKKSLSTIILLFLLIENVLTQGAPILPKNPNDVSFFDMEKKGKKPKDVNFRMGPSDIPNITVEIVKVNDEEASADYISNKSKLNIKWSIDATTNNAVAVNNKFLQDNGLAQVNAFGQNNQQNNVAPQNNASPQNGTVQQNAAQPNNGLTFTLKLLSNVTQDSTTNLFYSFNEIPIQSNVSGNEFEYKVKKLEENSVYNIIVIAEQPNSQKMNSIGISKTYKYRYIDKDTNNSEDAKGEKNSGINPVVYIIIGAVGIALIGLAYFLSKSFGKKDKHEDEDEYNLPVQSPTSPNASFGELGDRVSVVTDDTGEVSWSNLEIAQTSQQTKNEANDKVIRTLDRKFKRDDKNRSSSNVYVNGEKQVYKVARTFNPTEEDEIQLNIGDEVEITVIFEDGWCEGINLSTNKGGVFPRTCVVEVEQYASMIEKSKNTLVPNRRRSKRNSYSNPPNFHYVKSNLNVPANIQE